APPQSTSTAHGRLSMGKAVVRSNTIDWRKWRAKRRLGGCASMRNLGLLDLVRGPDIEQMAIFFGVVGTVADRKHIADREADEVDRYRDLPPLRLVKQCARPEIADPALAQLGGGIGDRSPGIHDVVDEQYRSPCKVWPGHRREAAPYRCSLWQDHNCSAA